MATIASLTEKFINPSTLRAWFRGGLPTGKGIFAVVDVRDSDFMGGHIKGCYHYPSATFPEDIENLKQILTANKVDDIVFHCALSQVRGPSSALKFIRSLEDPAQFNVWILRGGFTKWQAEYGDDPEVTEGYNAELWRGFD